MRARWALRIEAEFCLLDDVFSVVQSSSLQVSHRMTRGLSGSER